MRVKRKIPEIVLGALLALLILLIGWAASFTYHYPAHHPTKAAAEQPNSNQPQSHGFWDWLHYDAAGYFTFWLVFIGGVQVAIFIWQLRLIRQSLSPAKDAAKAALEGLQQTRDAFEKLQRPYVYVFDVMLKPGIGHSEPILAVYYDAANFGTTPAVITSIWIACEVGPTGEPPTLERQYDHTLLTSDSMRSGKQHDKLNFKLRTPITVRAWKLDIPVGSDLNIHIEIEYRGPFSSGHKTSGWWGYDATHRRFVRIGGERYNYER